MYSYLYDNKFLLWITIIFMFIGMITVTIILYLCFTHTVGEKWYFACQYFLQSEYGDVLYISTDKINIDTIYLEDREDNLYAHPEEYFKILEQGRFKREVF